MTHMLRPPHARIVVGPREGGFFREAWARVRRPAPAGFWRLRAQWLLHRGTSEPNRWRNPVWTSAVVWFYWPVDSP